MAPRKQVTKLQTAGSVTDNKVHAKPEKTVSVQPEIKKPYLFAKGVSGNPSGRPKGSRNKLDEVFVAAIYEAFEAGGAKAIMTVMETDPTAFLNVVAKILPKHVHQQVQVKLAEMSDIELANIAAGGRAGAVETSPMQAQLN